jgi:hypothetical protein
MLGKTQKMEEEVAGKAGNEWHERILLYSVVQWLRHYSIKVRPVNRLFFIFSVKKPLPYRTYPAIPS